jgi:hypothetical protein
VLRGAPVHRFDDAADVDRGAVEAQVRLVGHQPRQAFLHQAHQWRAEQQHRRDDERLGAHVHAQRDPVVAQAHVDQRWHLPGHRNER